MVTMLVMTSGVSPRILKRALGTFVPFSAQRRHDEQHLWD